MLTKEKLKNYANKLMFDMEDSEYETLLKEFEVIEKQMELIGEIENIGEAQPMTFPFELENVELRDDSKSRSIEIEDALRNSADKKGREVKVPKVVE